MPENNVVSIGMTPPVASVPPATVAGQEPAQTVAPPVPPPAPEMHKIVLDDGEVEVSTDDLRRGYERREVLARREKEVMESARVAREQLARATGFLEGLKDRQTALALLSDPRLKEELGFDFRQIATDYLAADYQEQSLTPEQREIREIRAEMQRRDHRDNLSRQQEAAFREQEELEAARHRTAAVVSAVLREGGLPDNPVTIGAAAEVLVAARNDGWSPSRDQLIEETTELLKSRSVNVLAGYEGEKLLDFAGPELTKRFAAAILARARGQAQKPFEQPSVPATGQAQPQATRGGPVRVVGAGRRGGFVGF